MHPQTGLNLTELLSREHRRELANVKANARHADATHELDPSYLTLRPDAGGPGPGPAAPGHEMGIQPPPEGLLLVPASTLDALAATVYQIEDHMRLVSERVRKHMPGDWHVVDRVVLSTAIPTDGYQLRGNPVFVAGRSPTRRLTIYNPSSLPVDVTDASGAGSMLTVPPQTVVVMPWNADNVIVSTASAITADVSVLLVRSDRETDEITAYPLGSAVNTTTAAPSLFNEATGLAEQQRTPTAFHQVAASGVASNVIWTPAAGKSYRLMGGFVNLTAEANITGAAEVTVQLKDSGGNVYMAARVFLPSASVTTGLGAQVIIPPFNFPGNGVLAPAPNNTLQLNIQTPLTNGVYEASVWGTEE